MKIKPKSRIMVLPPSLNYNIIVLPLSCIFPFRSIRWTMKPKHLLRDKSGLLPCSVHSCLFVDAQGIIETIDFLNGIVIPVHVAIDITSDYTQ